MQMIDIECDTRQDKRAVQPVKIVAGNKCDLKEARVISSRQGLEYARAKGCGFMETSAREMVNIEETFARKSTFSSPHAARQLENYEEPDSPNVHKCLHLPPV